MHLDVHLLLDIVVRGETTGTLVPVFVCFGVVVIPVAAAPWLLSRCVIAYDFELTRCVSMKS